jgi:hypothetical protein
VGNAIMVLSNKTTMRLFFIVMITLMFGIACHVKSQTLNSKRNKIIFWVYSQDNPRIASCGNTDTIEIVQTKLADSLYYTKTIDKRGKGYLNIDFKVDLKQKQASYIQDDFACTGDDDESIPVRRDTFKVKYLDNRIFIPYDSEKRYFIYRYLVYNIEYIPYSNSYDTTASVIYWSKNYGFILQKFFSYESLMRFEYLNNEKYNEIIRHLCSFIYRDTKFNTLPDWETRIKE